MPIIFQFFNFINKFILYLFLVIIWLLYYYINHMIDTVLVLLIIFPIFDNLLTDHILITRIITIFLCIDFFFTINSKISLT